MTERHASEWLAPAVALGLAIASLLWVTTPASQPESFRIELGATEDGYLVGNASSWGRAYRDQAPVRIRRGVRRRSFFAARMAFPESGVEIPARPTSGDGTLRLRIHRYGQPGVIKVFGNGLELDSLVMEADRYPWAVHEIPVPARVFRDARLLVEFRGEDLVSSPELEPEALVAFDWVELTPATGATGMTLEPAARFWLWLLPILVAILVWLALLAIRFDARIALSGLAGGASLVASWWCLTVEPAAILAFARHVPAWLVMGLGIFGASRLVGIAPTRTAAMLASMVTLVSLGHGTILFFPNHQPPDLGPHLGQVRALDSLDLAGESFLDFSASFGVGGRGKPHFGADYRAPYPPWTYFLIHLLRFFWDEPRFWLEFLAIASGGALIALSFALAHRVSSIPHAGWFAALIASVEISIWHHASRAHTPGMLGQVALMAAMLFLLHHYHRLRHPLSWTGLCVLSLAATLAYTATLFHLVLLVFVFTVLGIITHRRLGADGSTWLAVTAMAAGTLAAVAVFYGHFIGSAMTRSSEILAEAGYKAPATFYFLRNQMRDTVRILGGGYPWFVLLAVPAFVRLRSWGRGEPERRLLWAWGATWILMLVLKDPAFLPQLFLHAKEDLFLAPALAVLGGITLAAAWQRGLAGRLPVLIILGGLVYLQALDFAFNADMITPWAASQLVEE